MLKKKYINKIIMSGVFGFVGACAVENQSEKVLREFPLEDFQKRCGDIVDMYDIKNTASHELQNAIAAILGYNITSLADIKDLDNIVNFQLFARIYGDYINEANKVDVFSSHDFKRIFLVAVYYHIKHIAMTNAVIERRAYFTPEEANVDKAFATIIKQHLNLTGSLRFLQCALEKRNNSKIESLTNIFNVKLYGDESAVKIKDTLINLSKEIEKLRVFYGDFADPSVVVMQYVMENQEKLLEAIKTLSHTTKDIESPNVGAKDVVIINIISSLIKVLSLVLDGQDLNTIKGLVPEQIIIAKKFIHYFDTATTDLSQPLFNRYANCLETIISNPYFINVLFGAAMYIDYYAAIQDLLKSKDNLVTLFDFNTYHRDTKQKKAVNYIDFCHSTVLQSCTRVLNTISFPETVKHMFVVGPSGSGKTMLIRSIQIVQQLAKKYCLSIGKMEDVRLYDVVLDYTTICAILKALDARVAMEKNIPIKNSDGRIQYTAMLIINEIVKKNKDKRFFIVLNEPFVNVPVEQLSLHNGHSLLFNLESLLRADNATVFFDSHLNPLKHFAFTRLDTCSIGVVYMPIQKDDIASWSSFPTFKLQMKLPDKYVANVLETNKTLQKIEELPDESYMRQALVLAYREAAIWEQAINEYLGV